MPLQGIACDQFADRRGVDTGLFLLYRRFEEPIRSFLLAFFEWTGMDVKFVALNWNEQDFTRDSMVRKSGGCQYAEQRIAHTKHSEGKTFVKNWECFNLVMGSLGWK